MTVLVFLASFAVILSWLCTYALTNALIAADLMQPFPHEGDPRPRWMFHAFLACFAVSVVVGLVFRFTSRRQLRRIDEMADAE